MVEWIGGIYIGFMDVKKKQYESRDQGDPYFPMKQPRALEGNAADLSKNPRLNSDSNIPLSKYTGQNKTQCFVNCFMLFYIVFYCVL